MDDSSDGGRLEVRTPDVGDLVRLARALRKEGARYVLIGGFAVIAHGLARTTKDIDLLVDPDPENVARIKRALSILEDNAASEIDPSDLLKYPVVRVADEVMINLLASACGVTWADAAPHAKTLELRGVTIPLAAVETLIATKQTPRPSDAADREFLEYLLAENASVETTDP